MLDDKKCPVYLIDVAFGTRVDHLFLRATVYFRVAKSFETNEIRARAREQLATPASFTRRFIADD